MKKQPTYFDQYKSIDVENDWNSVRYRMGFQRSYRMIPLWRVAAVILLLLSAGFMFQQYIMKGPELLTASTGEQERQVMLPDGSQIYLNKNTKFSYPEKFGRKAREVKISGEGYFEIARDPRKPFIVYVADKAIIKVLGTSFNIDALSDEKLISVQVVEGKVSFTNVDKRIDAEILSAGDQAELHDGLITLKPVKDSNFLSWKTGIIYFQQEPVEKAMKILSKYYGIEFVADLTVDPSLTFTSIIDNQDLTSVLEEMSLVLGIAYRIDGHRVKLSMSD